MRHTEEFHPVLSLLGLLPYMYSCVGFYSKLGSLLSLEKMTSFSQSDKGVEMATVTCCCLIPPGIKCDCSLVDLMFPGQSALGPVGDCPVRSYGDSLLVFQALPLPPNHIYVPPLPLTALAQTLLLHPCFPTTSCQLSLDFLLIWGFLLNFFSCSFSTFPLPLLF